MTEPNMTEPVDPPAPVTAPSERSARLRLAWEAGETLSLQEAKQRFGVSEQQFYDTKKALMRKGRLFKKTPDGNRFLWTMTGTVDTSKTALAEARNGRASNAPSKAVPKHLAQPLPPFGAIVQVVGLRWNSDDTVAITLQGEEREWTFQAQRWFET